MLCSLLYRAAPARRPRFYRVEVTYNLLGEVSVLREWGVAGRQGRSLIRIFGNLREACLAADSWRTRAMRSGYQPGHQGNVIDHWP